MAGIVEGNNHSTSLKRLPYPGLCQRGVFSTCCEQWVRARQRACIEGYLITNMVIDGYRMSVLFRRISCEIQSAEQYP